MDIPVSILVLFIDESLPKNLNSTVCETAAALRKGDASIIYDANKQIITKSIKNSLN